LTDTDNCGACDTVCGTDELCHGGACIGEPNGFGVEDPWDELWDGLQRAPRTWEEARDDCVRLRGRLPTITELFRNNAGPSGTGAIASPTDTSHLWTLIADYQDPFRVTVRLSDGTVGYQNETTTHAYRCVWPDRTSDGFDEAHCYGPADTECRPHRLLWNLDQIDRPPVHYAAAVNECNFYNASVTTMQDFAEAVQQGWSNPSNTWLWLAESKYWYNGAFGQAVGRWSTDPQPTWGYDAGTDGSLAYGYNNHPFRCIGKQRASEGELPSPTCEGGACFSISANRRSRLLADNNDRAAANHAAAAAACYALGGSLPNGSEFTELIHAGWENGSSAWLWTGDPLYWYNGGYGYAVMQWTDTGTERWYVAGPSQMERSGPATERPYRCVFHERFDGAEPTACGPRENQVWDEDGRTFSCEAAVTGSSEGMANPSGLEVIDAWGNAWDLLQRATADYDTAMAACGGMGGRLPTATELWRVRANQSLTASVGDETATSYLWTLVPEYRTGRRILLRVSDGDTTNDVETGSYPYRCIWPTTVGNVFTGRSCVGEGPDPCFTVGRLRTDRYDRAPLPASSATWECAYYGGQLPDADQLGELIQAGLVNGTDAWIWVQRPIYWYSGGYGYAVARWPGAGPAEWAFGTTPSYGSLSWETNHRGFRCVSTDTFE
jgi:hypothetical protein